MLSGNIIDMTSCGRGTKDAIWKQEKEKLMI